jgi:3-phenylpropionate/trans-cinnamate dioxygenase ferredoxin subunit
MASPSKRIAIGPADLAEGELRSVELGDKMLLVVRQQQRYFALDDWCNHAGCLLSGGRLEKSSVICPCHEVGFDLATGRVSTRPIICDDQKIFPIEEQDGTLYITFADADLPKER